jgi:hypothetical protein
MVLYEHGQNTYIACLLISPSNHSRSQSASRRAALPWGAVFDSQHDARRGADR